MQEESREEPLQTTESSQKNDEVDTEMITSTIEPVTAVPNMEVDSEVQIPVLGKQRLESILEEDEEDVSEQSQRNENAETEAAKDECGSSQDGQTVNQLSEAKEPTDGEQHKQDLDADEQQSSTDCQDHPGQYSGDNSNNHEAKSSPETVNIRQEQESPRDDAGDSTAGQKDLVETEGHSSHSSHEHMHQLQDDSEQPADQEQHKQDHDADEQQSSTDHPGQYSGDNSNNHGVKSSPETVNIGHEQESPRDDAGGSIAVQVETEEHSSHSSHEHTHQLRDDSEQLVNTHQS